MTSSTMQRMLDAAADARGQGVRARGDRPSARRWAEQPGSGAIVRTVAPRMEIRAAAGDSGALHFDGFASVYNRGYEMWDWYGPYTEQVTSGAGASSLARADLDVPLVLDHDTMRRIARTTNGSLSLTEQSVDGVEGLHVDAPQLDASDPDVAYIAPKLRNGLIDEMSFRFMITRGEWSPDWDEFHIKEYDIHRGDVAIVGYGANPHTQGAGLRSEMTEQAERALENRMHAARKAGAGSTGLLELLELDSAPRHP